MIWSHLRYKGEKIDFEILNFKTLAELLRPPVVWKLKNFYSFYQMVISSAKINALMYVVEKFSMGIASCTWSFRLVISKKILEQFFCLLKKMISLVRVCPDHVQEHLSGLRNLKKIFLIFF